MEFSIRHNQIETTKHSFEGLRPRKKNFFSLSNVTSVVHQVASICISTQFMQRHVIIWRSKAHQKNIVWLKEMVDACH